MPHAVNFGKRERLSFAKSPEIMNLPNLIEIQKLSYHEFLQADVDDDKRKDESLQAVFNEIFPITDFSETSSLEFVSYSLGSPKYDINECQYRGFTYGVPLKIRLQLILREKDKDTGDKHVIDIKESDVYMGEIPLMTEKGTFFINGAERVIVSQLHRSPGATFNEAIHTSGHKLFVAKIVPYRGAWIEFEYDIKDHIYVRIDRRKKMLVTILLRALGWETDEKILKLFARTEVQTLSNKSNSPEVLKDRVLAAPVIDSSSGEVLHEANIDLTEEELATLQEAGVESIEVLNEEDARRIQFLRNTLKRDVQSDYKEGHIQDQALVEIFRRIQPGDPPTLESARSRFEKLIFEDRKSVV